MEALGSTTLDDDGVRQGDSRARGPVGRRTAHVGVHARVELEMTVYRVVLLAGSITALTVAVTAQQSDTTRNPLGADSASVIAGQRLYDQGCAGCHAAAGQGSDRAPTLN